MKIITSFTLDCDLEKIAEESFEYDGPMALAKGGSTTTTPPPPTADQLAADHLRLVEMQRQNTLAEAMLPGQQANIQLQNRLIQYQLDHVGDLDELHKQQLALATAQLQSSISDEAMKQELRPEQLAFLHSQNALAVKQIEAMGETTDFQRQQNKFILAGLQDQADKIAAYNKIFTPEQQAQAAADEAQRGSRMSALSEEAANIQLENLKRGTKPTDEQLANINEAYDASQKMGESNISDYLKQTLRQINEETAMSSGLRPTDAPVLRLSERAGEQAGRAQGQLTNSIEQGRATARLNYPLAASQLAGNQASTLQGLSAGAANFQDQLAAQASANRSQAFNLPSSAGFVMPQGSAPVNLGFMNANPIGNNPNAFTGSSGFYNPGSTTQNTNRDTTIGEWGQGAAGVGSIIGAVALF